jgi:hypothetical protein
VALLAAIEAGFFLSDFTSFCVGQAAETRTIISPFLNTGFRRNVLALKRFSSVEVLTLVSYLMTWKSVIQNEGYLVSH